MASRAAASGFNTVVSGSSATDSASVKTATAYCPPGMRVYGGGGDLSNGGHGVSLTALRPESQRVGDEYHDSFTVTAEEVYTGYTVNWTVYAWAICGRHLLNVSIEASKLSNDRSGVREDKLEGVVSCPKGTAPVGLGAEITHEEPLSSGRVILSSFSGNYRAGPYGLASGTAGSRAFAIPGANQYRWGLASYAVCATPPPGLSYQFADSANDSQDKTVSVKCPIGKYVYGVGASVDYRSSDVYLDRAVPFGSNWDGADLDVRERQPAFSAPWFAQIEAICAE